MDACRIRCGGAVRVWLTVLAAWLAAVAGPARAAEWHDKVDLLVLDSFATAPGGTVACMVLLGEQADLAGAGRLLTKEEKGAYVCRVLAEHAARTQKPVIDALQRAGAPHRAFWAANLVWAECDMATVQRVASRPEVSAVCANSRVLLRRPFPARPELARLAPSAVEWNLTIIRAPQVWARGITGAGVVVAGQDTGYDWDHPALIRQYRGWDGTNANHAYNWHDAIHSGGGACGADSPFPCDDNNHGTHTMGTMVGDDGAGNQVGVAPGARWIGCRNMSQGVGTPATYTECFQWLMAPTDAAGLNPDPTKAPDVINNSWGCPGYEGCTNIDMLRSVVENTRASGILVVAAAGNSGSGCSSVSEQPALFDASFTVGATDSGDSIVSFSSRGNVTADGSGRMKPDVSAPGQNVRSSFPGTGYGLDSGTSMAGPHVAGVAALVFSAHPGLRGQVDRVERLITRTATPRTSAQTCGGVSGSEVPNNTYGWGRVNAEAAVGLDDADGDTVPDWWEIVFELSPTNATDAAEDPDGDGFTTRQEYAANTDPTNAGSALRMVWARSDATGAVMVAWRTRPDGFDAPRAYDLQRADGPLGPSNAWVTVRPMISATGDVTTACDDVSGSGATEWLYRVTLARTGTPVRALQPVGLSRIGGPISPVDGRLAGLR